MPGLSYETSIIVNAPIETIYDYLADFPRHVEWNHQPQKMMPLTEGPVRVGSRFQTKEQMPSNWPTGQKVMFTLATAYMKLMYGAVDYTVAEITALEPHTRVAWKAHAPSKKGDMMRMNWEIQLEPQGAATQVTQRCEMAPPDTSPAAKMLQGDKGQDMVKQAKGEVALNLNRMKGIVERQATAQPTTV